MALLTIRRDTHPATNRIIALASIVATFTVLHYKNGVSGSGGYKPRPRPSMICPALSPPVPIPGHAAYPSGHATEAHLIALCLEDVLVGSIQLTAMQPDLTALARRIARNREIAGLHYPSDAVAGAQLAVDILPYLQGTAEYTAALALAQLEWV